MNNQEEKVKLMEEKMKQSDAKDWNSAHRNKKAAAVQILSRMKASVDQYAEQDAVAHDESHHDKWLMLSHEISKLIDILNPEVRRRRPESDTPCYLLYKGVQRAQGIWKPDGTILVLAGSDALPVNVPLSKNVGYIPERRRLEDEGIVKNGKFVQERLFDSVSCAAAVVIGHSAADGRRFWHRRSDGTFLR